MPLHPRFSSLFFFNDTATTEIYTLSLHDALPISHRFRSAHGGRGAFPASEDPPTALKPNSSLRGRSEEHTSELQSPCNLVCRLLLEKKKENDDILLVRERASSSRIGWSGGLCSSC